MLRKKAIVGYIELLSYSNKGCDAFTRHRFPCSTNGAGKWKKLMLDNQAGDIIYPAFFYFFSNYCNFLCYLYDYYMSQQDKEGIT